jgi:hypothetical protein
VGIFDTIGDALAGKSTPDASGPSDTKTTKVTADDIAATQRRRNSPEFQAALRAQAQAKAGLKPGDFAFQPPLRTSPAD